MAKEERSDRFQGLCLMSSSGSEHMRDYDALPEPIRKRLQQSPFNLCPACVRWPRTGIKDQESMMTHMESMLREQEINSRTVP